jgi:hypothetical protein
VLDNGLARWRTTIVEVDQMYVEKAKDERYDLYIERFLYGLSDLRENAIQIKQTAAARGNEPLPIPPPQPGAPRGWGPPNKRSQENPKGLIHISAYLGTTVPHLGKSICGKGQTTRR